MARSRHQRRRLAAVGMAATLALGGAGGWLVGAGRGRSSSVAPLAAASSTTTAVPPAFGSAVSGGSFAGSDGVTKLTRKFVRTTADGVTIRAYQAPAADFAPVPGCPIGLASLEVEVSTANVAAQTFGPFVSAGTPLKGVSTSLIGAAEGAPVWVVTVATDSTVAEVRATFADGRTDQMAPVDGSAALAHVAPVGSTELPVGSVDALDGAGKVIGHASFQSPKPILPPGTNIITPDGPAPGATAQASPGKPALAPSTVLGSAPETAVSPTTAPGPSAETALPLTTTPTSPPNAGSPPQTLVPMTVPLPPCALKVPPPAPASTSTVTKASK